MLARVAKRIYFRVSGLSWDTVIALTAFHFGVSWGLLFLIGGENISSGDIFWYFYLISATTVGYGDYSPATEAGRMVTVLWVIPGGIALFTTIIPTRSRLAYCRNG